MEEMSTVLPGSEITDTSLSHIFFTLITSLFLGQLPTTFLFNFLGRCSGRQSWSILDKKSICEKRTGRHMMEMVVIRLKEAADESLSSWVPRCR